MPDNKEAKELKDNEAVYDEQISPLMEQIIQICKDNDLPMTLCFEFAPEAYCASNIPVAGQSEKMTQIMRLVDPNRSRVSMSAITVTDGDGEVVKKEIIAFVE